MINPEKIYNDYSNKIYNLAYRLTGNRNDADDITQDTFIQASKNIDKFKGESQIYTWLYSIAKNNCLKLLKSKKKLQFSDIEILAKFNSSPFSDQISEEDKSNYISQVKDGCLTGLLRCLSLQQRLAFVLNVLLNIPVKEVAIIIDNSENATRILIHRAKQNLRSFLCNNCSLYDSTNSCRCENLINFSLKNKWISLYPHVTPSSIEHEIGNLKNVIQLYKTIGEQLPSENIKQIINQKANFLIFNAKKVK